MHARMLLLTRTLLILPLVLGSATNAQSLPDRDLRADGVHDLNTPREFPAIQSRPHWEDHARVIRDQVRVSCGLWPPPPKTPLNARVFDRSEFDGYSVEKVVLETRPGFHLAGNLWRPLGQGNGPFPAILNPHGHWGPGRLVDTGDGSVPARCIQFARSGMIAFSYDMIGYNDTVQFPNHRDIALDPTNQLWLINLMGLQTWNSQRALDFLESLPDVDASRLASTGASGGGTQTFILGAIDERPALLAPMVMVSHSMQGGCLCENAPGLRVDHSNMEIAAVPAPRPQILVAATGDWTRATLEIEGPSIAGIYELFAAPDRFRYRLFDFGHNYNQTTREAVYAWLDHWFLRKPLADFHPELPYTKPPDSALRVFPDGRPPANAVSQEELIRQIVVESNEHLAAIQPSDEKSLIEFKAVMTPAWKHSLQLEIPATSLLVETGGVHTSDAWVATTLALGRKDRGDRLPATLFSPQNNAQKTFVVLAHPDGQRAFLDGESRPMGLAKQLVDRGASVLVFDAFQTGSLKTDYLPQPATLFTNFFTTYNRTPIQQRVQDLITACAYGRARNEEGRLVLCGFDRAGPWALLAASAADAVLADADGLESSSALALMDPELFSPGLLKYDSFQTAPLLGAPNPLFIHNTGSHFNTGRLRTAYAAMRAESRLRLHPEKLEPAALADWILQLP